MNIRNLPWETIYNNFWMAGIFLLTWLYIQKFNEFSETQLVRWSYAWLPLLIFGLAGHFALKSYVSSGLDDPEMAALVVAAKWTVICMAALIIFYEVFWDQL